MLLQDTVLPVPARRLLLLWLRTLVRDGTPYKLLRQTLTRFPSESDDHLCRTPVLRWGAPQPSNLSILCWAFLQAAGLPPLLWSQSWSMSPAVGFRVRMFQTQLHDIYGFKQSV